MISALLNLLACVLLPRMRFILLNGPCEFEKNVYSSVVRWSTDIHNIPLTEGVVESNCGLTDVMPAAYVHF